MYAAQASTGVEHDCFESTGLDSRQAEHQKHSAQHLQIQCQALLSSHATSISTDEKLLQTLQSLTPRHAQAVRARVEHKLLIAATTELLETYVGVISTFCD